MSSQEHDREFSFKILCVSLISNKTFLRGMILLLIIVIFLGIKLSNNAINFFTDTETYFYTAYELLHGKLLYKDIFFTNLPLFPYISAFYFFLTRGNIYGYYFTASVEAAFVGLVIYKIVYRETQDYFISIASVSLYSFSLITLFITNGQTGIITASFFATLAYYFLQGKKYILSGIFLSLCFLTKGYFIVAILPFFISNLFIKHKNKYNLYIGFIFVTGIILLPFVFTSWNEVLRDTIQFYLSKGSGMSKTAILQYLIFYDPFLLALLIYNLFRIHKNLLFGMLSLFVTSYFIFSAGFYYAYFSMIVPFLCISFPDSLYSLMRASNIKKNVLVILTGVYIFYPLFIYVFLFSSQNQVVHFSQMIETIKKEKPTYIYGISSLSPALAYETNTPLLENIIDTNEDLYKNKIYNGTKLTKEAIHKRAMLISVGSFYPNQNIREDVVNISIDKTLAEKYCHYVKDFDENIDAGVNRVNFYKCY